MRIYLILLKHMRLFKSCLRVLFSRLSEESEFCGLTTKAAESFKLLVREFTLKRE